MIYIGQGLLIAYYFVLLYLFKCVSGLSVFAILGDVFYTLYFYLMTLRTMSHSGWGEKVVVDIKKKTNLLTVFAIIKTI